MKVMKVEHWTGSLAVILCLLAAQTLQAQPVTTGTLVRDMTDLERLARFPDPAYETIQFSSYDRRSDLPGGPDWYANSDGFGGEPIPNVEEVLEEAGADGIGTYLLCDVKGPGAMVRTWTARMNGTVRVYLDGSEEPLYQGSADRFLEKTYYPLLEETGPDSTLLEGAFFQRDAGYFPVPFAERLRVEWTGDLAKLHFYEIQVRKYAEGTNVETFSPEDLQTYQTAIEEAAAVLSNPSEAYAYPSDQDAQSFSASVPAGETRTLVGLSGPQAITRLTLKVEAGDLVRALRQSVLRISFDGHPWAQVQSPVGDFFGAAPGVNPYESLPFTVRPDGRMTSRFVMPFADSARVVVENRGDEPVTIGGSVLPAAYTWDDERSMHFRARWRVDHVMSPTAPVDLPFVMADGKGVYVGTTSLLKNPSRVPAPGGSWWGEGDEKIFVDGDDQPSIFGTGSEDYYNYSWSSPDIFDYAYAGQPRNDGPGNRGFVANYRWHILDPIPFLDQLRFYMELFRHEYEPGFTYARTSYLYGRPGLTDDHVPVSDEDVRPPRLKGWEPIASGSAQNATFYQTEELVDDSSRTRLDEGALWAGGQLFVWEPEQEGDSLQITLPVSEQGSYRLYLTVAQDSTSGMFSSHLDGERLEMHSFMVDHPSAERLNLYKPHRQALRSYRTAPLELETGEHSLRLQYEGHEDGAGSDIGIDFIWLQSQ